MKRRFLVVGVVAAAMLAVAVGAWHLLWRSDLPPSTPGRPGDVPTEGVRGASRAAGQIRLSSDPPGARIWLDGEDLGRSTPDLFGVSPRHRHGIRLVLDGYEAADLEIRLASGEVREVHVDLVALRRGSSPDLGREK